MATLELLYELTIVQRNVENNDSDANEALFRIIHNMVSAAREGADIIELKQRYLDMCQTDFYKDLGIGRDLIKLQSVFEPG